MIQVGTNVFKTKKQLGESVRALLRGHVGETIKEKDPAFGFLLDVIKRHPRAEEKIGYGISSIEVGYNRLNKKAIEINLNRKDGTKTDISWVRCISGIKMSYEAKLISAMREAIWPQIKSYYDWVSADFAGFICEECEIDLNGDLSHVDHVIPFKDLAKHFLGLYSPPESFDDCEQTNRAKFKKDQNSAQFKKAWIEYHESCAKLRLLCIPCHKTVTAEQQRAVKT